LLGGFTAEDADSLVLWTDDNIDTSKSSKNQYNRYCFLDLCIFCFLVVKLFILSTACMWFIVHHLSAALWPPYVADVDIIFWSCFFFLSVFFSSPNLSGRRLDVYHTSTHDVALVRI